MEQYIKPRVGVGTIIRKGDKVLLGKRKGSHGAGSWSFPGGHLEPHEDAFDCAMRETREETGIEIENLRMGNFTNDIFEAEGKHYITLFVVCDYASGNITVCEPDKIEAWGWHTWDALPQPLFAPIASLLRQSYSPFDSDQK